MIYRGFEMMEFPEWLYHFKVNNPDLVIEEILNYEHYLDLSSKDLKFLQESGIEIQQTDSYVGTLDPDFDPLFMRDLKEEFQNKRREDRDRIDKYLSFL